MAQSTICAHYYAAQMRGTASDAGGGPGGGADGDDRILQRESQRSPGRARKATHAFPSFQAEDVLVRP